MTVGGSVTFAMGLAVWVEVNVERARWCTGYGHDGHDERMTVVVHGLAVDSIVSHMCSGTSVRVRVFDRAGGPVDPLGGWGVPPLLPATSSDLFVSRLRRIMQSWCGERLGACLSERWWHVDVSRETRASSDLRALWSETHDQRYLLVRVHIRYEWQLIEED